MSALTSGAATDAQIGAALGALRGRGVWDAEELAAFARVIRGRASNIQHPFPDLVDTCGTGGGAPSFNISTAAAIVASACRVRIAKHGNRAVTSACGSADVLESLGVSIQTDEGSLVAMLESIGIGFLYAPSFHPAMATVGRARRELGFRTVFNVLGPLANPLGAQMQLVGVYEPQLLRPVAEALRLLGSQRAIIAHGEDGLDEISPCAPTQVAILWEGEVREETWRPSDFGIEPLSATHIAPAATLEGNAELLLEAITDADSPRSLAILPSAACAIWISGKTASLGEAVDRGREAITHGAARERLAEFVERSRK